MVVVIYIYFQVQGAEEEDTTALNKSPSCKHLHLSSSIQRLLLFFFKTQIKSDLDIKKDIQSRNYQNAKKPSKSGPLLAVKRHMAFISI